MKAEEVKIVVDKLIGKIHPISSSEYDSECLKNIDEYIDLCDMMIGELWNISSIHENSPYDSSLKVGVKASQFLDGLREYLSENLN